MTSPDYNLECPMCHAPVPVTKLECYRAQRVRCPNCGLEWNEHPVKE